MKGIVARVVGLSVAVVAVSVSLTAETPKPQTARVPLVTDWSHRHVIFSQPRTPEQTAKFQNNIRYLQQQARHSASPKISTQVDRDSLRRFRRMHRRYGRRRLHRDWSWDLGPGATVGAGRYPAKYGFNSNIATCGLAASPDFIMFPTNKPGASNQGSIVAATNLYQGCGGPVPANYWSYNTGGTVNTSPTFSLDGAQVAFVQTSSGTSSLVLLKWKKFDGQVNSPSLFLATVLPSGYLACSAPCMTTLALNANDTNSSVFYDFQNDIAIVGDDAGKLHQFTGVFKGTPTETGGSWPVTVNPGAPKPLTNAVYDFNTGNTLVNDTGGFLYRVDSTGATVVQSAQLDTGTGFTDGPIVDLGNGSVYVFSSRDNVGANAAVYQLNTSFTAGATGTEVAIGAATGGTTPVYDGAVDHNYIWGPDPGHIYVCGNPGGKPTLYQIPVLGGTIQTALAGPVLSGTTGTTCSPVTDIYNPNISGAGLPEEWTFLSVQANGTPTACNGHSCVMNFRVTSWQPNTPYNAGQLVLDSNLNIQVADNSGGTSGATPPIWGTSLYDQTLDGGVHWRNQGALSGPTPDTWLLNNPYTGASEIVDSNNNIEIAVPPGGTSGGTQPTWPLAEGATTTDGTVTWINLGANPVSGLEASGGSSGIVLDNTINAADKSQVYFSNLQDAACGISGPVGGCAIQASQQGLN